MKFISKLSILVVIIPFLGIPDLWKTWLLVIIGILILLKSLYLQRFFGSQKIIDSSFKQNGHDIENSKVVADKIINNISDETSPEN